MSAGQHRPEFATNRDRNHRADRRTHTEFVELKISLGGENRPGESAGDDDDQLRTQTDLDDLAQKSRQRSLLREDRDRKFPPASTTTSPI